MRKSSIFCICITIQVLLLGLAFTHAALKKGASESFLQEKMKTVERLALTDLCLFTEASYTRHLSQADFHTPFQDSPVALEHFPSGSLALPAPFAKKIHEKVY